VLSVSELNEQAKTLLETTFSYVEVGGEISRLVKHGSGHWYFTLKDEKAAQYFDFWERMANGSFAVVSQFVKSL